MKLSFLTIFLAISSLQSAPTECSTDLLASYGLMGQKIPQKIKLEMCPTITTSCCSVEDQLSMYTNWIRNNEAKLVETRYKNLEIIYGNLLVSLTKVQHIAEEVKQKLKIKKVANCKILAERVLVFQIDKISAKIRENLDDMQEFFEETFQGFYCTICDFENQQYFDFSKKIVTFSEKFCRDIVENTLPNLLFFHIEIVKYLNLVSKFLVSCDYKGDYKQDGEVKQELIFTVMPDVKHMLSECKNYRNHKSWFVYCKDVCEHFQIAEFNEFFEPNLEKIEHYIDFLEQEIKEYQHESIAAPMALGNAPPHHKKKALLAKKEKLVKKKLRLLESDNSHDNPNMIFKSGLHSKIHLDTFKTEFHDDGISMTDDGRNSLINPEMYNQIKTTIHLTKPDIGSVYTGTVDEHGNKVPPASYNAPSTGMTSTDKALIAAVKPRSFVQIVTALAGCIYIAFA